MTTTEAFLQALETERIKSKYPDSTIRTWRSRANRDKLSLDFMVAFLLDNGYHPKQTMQWANSDVVGDSTKRARTTDMWASENEEVNKTKTELGKKLFAVRKHMSGDLLSQWFDWCKEEHAKDFPNKKQKFTDAVFSQMTYGRYISKDNVLFALKALREGKRLVQEFEMHVEQELQRL